MFLIKTKLESINKTYNQKERYDCYQIDNDDTQNNAYTNRQINVYDMNEAS